MAGTSAVGASGKLLENVSSLSEPNVDNDKFISSSVPLL